MSRFPPRAGLALVLLGATMLSAAPGAAEFPFFGRLQPPLRADTFQLPRSVVADPHTGEIFVCDTFNHRILIFDRDGLFRYEITGGLNFRGPIDLAVDPGGYLFLLASHEGRRGLMRLDFDGRFLEEIGLAGGPPDLDPQRFTSVALSPDGRTVYLVDSGGKRLVVTESSGRVLRVADLVADVPEDEKDKQILAHVDAYGDLVLISYPTAGRVVVLDRDGVELRRVGFKGTAPCKVGFPVAAALDANGRMLILDKQRALFSVWEPLSNRCLSEHLGFGNAPGGLYQPDDLALDGQGRVYISQGFEGRVQVFAGGAAAATLVEPSPLPEPEPEPVASVGEPSAGTLAGREQVGVENLVEMELEEAVRRWAAAWSEQRIEDYLKAYADTFKPAAGLDREAWERQRRIRLERPRWIEVEVAEAGVEVLEPGRAQVVFLQSFRSDTYRDRVRKKLILIRQGTAWLVAAETVLEVFD